jgi:ribosomal protein RSM22 (predicted rRNA methylase)
MDLPQRLRQAVEEALEHTSVSDLAKASELLSSRYRSEIKDGQFHLSDDLAARAYLATRLPATYAAVSACLAAVAKMKPDFSPKNLLDVGSGPGTVMWAASEHWASLEEATLLEASPTIRAWGEKLGSPLADTQWITADVNAAFETTPSDLVTIAYVLNELDEEARATVLERLWSLTKNTLLIVEPGTPAGWERILSARTQLINAGAYIVAPCPHHETCPLVKPDWCHFSQRVARSRLHRQAKSAEVGWEDEKYSYLAVSRTPGIQVEARVLGTPRTRSGLVQLKLCKQDGTAKEQTVSKREGELFKTARRVNWGDTL